MNVHDADLDTARRRLAVSVVELWIDCFALGSHLDADGLASYLRGDLDVDNTEHNVIAHALNERFRSVGQDNPMAYFPV